MIQKLMDLVEVGNVAEKLKDEKRAEISSKVVRKYEDDRKSRHLWEQQVEEALKFAKQIVNPKNFPWENASNVVFPLLTTASNVFAARVYPEIIKDGKVVKVSIFGKDPDGMKQARADRISSHMSYQRLVESDSWEADTDKMLHMLPITGVAFRKVYYDVVTDMPQADLCNPDDVVVNNKESGLDKAERITHRYFISTNQLVEKMRNQVFLEVDIDELSNRSESADVFETNLDRRSYEDEEDSSHEILEQHNYLDLDDDGYQEPYIVSVHKASGTLLSIYPRFDVGKDVNVDEKGRILSIKPISYFIDYHFLPSPDGGFYSLGYGHILYPLNKAINSLMNQLIDSGTLANTQSGIISRQLKIKGGTLKVKMGEFIQADAGTTGRITDSVLPLPFKEPSPVLLQLLSLVIDSAREIASINDVLTGQANPQNSPAHTVSELAGQGMKLYNSITKRLYRSLKKEFKALFKLNGEYLAQEKYFNFLDDEKAISQEDYQYDDLDICPVADPNMSSDVQRSMQMQALTLVLQNQMVLPYIKLPAILKEFFETLKIPDYKIAQFLVSPEELQQQQQQPNPEGQKMQLEMMKMQKDFEIKQAQNERAKSELQLKMMEMERKYALKEQETAEKQKKLVAEALYKRSMAEGADKKLEIELRKVEQMEEKNEIEKAKLNE